MGLPFSIDDYDHLAGEICRVGRRMWAQGFCAGSDGNISARLGDDFIVITPSGVCKGEMRTDSLCVLRLSDRSVVHGHNPSSERAVHLAIYDARGDLEAVIHSHAPRSTAWACCGQDVPEAIHPEVELFLGRIPVVPYATPGTGALAKAAAQAMENDIVALLLGNHGTITVGTGLEQALQRLEMLEAYCRLLVDLRSIGSTQPITTHGMNELLQLKRDVWGLPDQRLPERS